MKAANDPRDVEPNNKQPAQAAPDNSSTAQLPSAAPDVPEMRDSEIPTADVADPAGVRVSNEEDLPQPTGDPQPSSPSPASAEDGIDMEDTTSLYGGGGDSMDDGGDAEMSNALIDALQVLGGSIPYRPLGSLVLIKKSKPSVIELYCRGSIVNGATSAHRNLNIRGMDALDLKTLKPGGQPWDFTKPADRRLALWRVQVRKPTSVIGAPPCTAFPSSRGINFAKMSKARVRQVIQEGRTHLDFMLKLYALQLKHHRRFLHGHPQSASSWADPLVQRFMQHPVFTLLWDTNANMASRPQIVLATFWLPRRRRGFFPHQSIC